MKPWRVCLFALVAIGGCSSSELGPFRVERFASLGGDSGRAAIPTWPRVSARHPGGFRIVIPQPGSSGFLPMVFDDGANFLGDLTGPAEQGRGFVRPLFARLGPGDSIWVFDVANRVLVFDQSRRYIRTVALTVSPWDAVVLGDARLAITGSTYGHSLPWLLVDGDGGVVRRIGKSDPRLPSPRRITAASDGSVWTITMTHRIRIERWDTSGTLLAAFDESPEWFQPYDQLRSPGPDVAPQSTVSGIWFGTDGNLWVLGRAADANWQQGLGEPIRGVTPIVHPDRAYDTRIEIRDPATGAVITGGRLDAAWPFEAGPGVLMRPVVIEGGWFRAELADVTMTTGGNRR